MSSEIRSAPGSLPKRFYIERGGESKVFMVAASKQHTSAASNILENFILVLTFTVISERMREREHLWFLAHQLYASREKYRLCDARVPS